MASALLSDPYMARFFFHLIGPSSFLHIAGLCSAQDILTHGGGLPYSNVTRAHIDTHLYVKPASLVVRVPVSSPSSLLWGG